MTTAIVFSTWSIMAAAVDVQALLARIGAPSKLVGLVGLGDKAVSGTRLQASRSGLVPSWPGLEEALPDGGLPRGVVELAAPFSLGGATSVALAAVRAGQSRAKEAWCAWVDPGASLYAPGVVRAGVDVSRLLVVCPERAAIGRTAVKVVASGAFEVVVVDADAMSRPGSPARSDRQAPRKRPLAPEVLVRKLALAAEPNGATVLLLTDSTRPRAVPWPVAMRLELRRPSLGDLSVRVAKDRRGRVGFESTVPFRPLLSGWFRAPAPNLPDWAALDARASSHRWLIGGTRWFADSGRRRIACIALTHARIEIARGRDRSPDGRRRLPARRLRTERARRARQHAPRRREPRGHGPRGEGGADRGRRAREVLRAPGESRRRRRGAGAARAPRRVDARLRPRRIVRRERRRRLGRRDGLRAPSCGE